MRKYSYFASDNREGWPDVAELERYFLAPPGQRWFFETRNDGGSLTVEGAAGTGHLERFKGRIDVYKMMWGHPELGVQLMYKRWGGGYDDVFYSRGDMSRLAEWVESLHEDLKPVGLFVPFDVAWLAVKEFIETDGALPKSIAWVSDRDLPPDTFPDPSAPGA
jgi:hypothetical protein